MICAMLAASVLPALASPPALTLPGSVTIGEDDTTNVTVDVTDSGVPIFTVTTTASSSDTNLVSDASLTFSGFGTSRLLAIRPGTHKSGTATITVVATDSTPSSTTNTFTLNVTYTNYPPIFLTIPASQTNNEDTASTNLSFSVYDIQSGESGLTFGATSTNTTLVPNANLVISGTGSNRTLTVTQATNQNGMTQIDIVVTNAGGATATNSFLYYVWAVNQPPTATMLASVLSYDEYNGPVTLPNFMTGISPGPANQSSETLSWSYLYTTNFFTQAPAIDGSGTLTFEAVTNISGTNTITFILTSSGSTTNGGKNSLTNVVTLQIGANLQLPSFTLATNLVFVNEESPGVTNSGFVTSVNKGISIENNATFSYSLATVTNHPTNAAFMVLALATNGNLTIKPRPHSFGTNTVTAVMTINGRYPGWVNVVSNTFQIAVEPTNHAPVIVGATNQTMLENATNSTIAINVWDYDTQSTNLVLTATSSNSSLATVSVTRTNVASATNAVFTLSFALATNSSGTIPVHLVATEGALSTTNTFVLAVSLVNQSPTFTLATNLVNVAEESATVNFTNFVSSVNKGPTNQNSETYKFAITTVTTNSTNAAFQTLAVAANGMLSVRPKAHSYGTNVVTLVMTLSGGNPRAGINAATNTFEIAVPQTSHAPVIVGATNHTVLENATNVLTATFNVWDYDRQSTNLVLTATSSNTSIATVSVTHTNVATATNALFTLTFALATNSSGTVPIRLVASESGLSTTNTFNLIVTLVNQPASFTLSTNYVQVTEESPVINVSNFVASISKGPSNQTSEPYKYIATTLTNNATNAAFQILAVATNGTLSVQPKAHSFGTNTVTLVLDLTGGVTNGGDNTVTNTFQIGVAQTNHAPVIVGATNHTILENATNGLTATINVWDYDKQSSNLVLTATSSNSSFATVSVTATNVVSATNALFTLAFAPGDNANGSVSIHLVASEGALSTNVSFNLVITPASKAPSFILATNWVAVLEESGAESYPRFVNAWNSSSSKIWSFLTFPAIGSPNNVSFAAAPAVDTNGALTFTPATHSYGTNQVQVIMTDSTNFFTNTFQIAVAQILHPPSIAFTNLTVFENGRTTPNNTTNAPIYVSDFDLGTNFVVTAISLNTNLGAVTVVTNAAGSNSVNCTLNFTLATNASGTAPIQLVAAETESQGSASTTNTFTLTVTPVNQAPSYSFSTNYVQNTNLPALLVVEETPAVTNIGFLTNLSAGPANESNQTWTFIPATVTGNSTNASFTSTPTVDTNGGLTFTVTPHTFGTNLVTVVMQDSGGTANGGVNSYTNSFMLEVAQTNHAPVIDGATNITVLENAISGLTNYITVWDYDQQTNFTITATSLNTNLTSVTVVTNSSATTNVYCGVSLALVADANGTATIQLMATEGPLTTTNTFTLTVVPVEQPPTYAFTTNGVTNNDLLVLENAGVTSFANFLTNLTAGPANQSNQTWTFTAATIMAGSTNVAFSQPPAIDTNGNLVFTTATNSFGTNTIAVVMTLSTNTTNGGINWSSNNFQLQVEQVPYPPRFIGVTNQMTLLENQTTNSTMAFTLYDPLTNNFTVTPTSTNTSMVTITSSGASNAYTLFFAPGTNANGTNTVTVTASDGTLNTTTNIVVIITPVNQPPFFNVGQSSITVDKYDVAASIPNVLTNIHAGPTNQFANESGQTVSFVVTNSNSNLFDTLPSFSSGGTLSFTPGDRAGTVTVGVQAQDNGGTANGGVNTSGWQTLTITIPANAFQYLAGPFTGLFYDTNAVANQSSGYVDLVLASNGTFTGYSLCAGLSNAITGQFDISNSLANVTNGNYIMDLTVDTTTNWTESITGSVTNTSAHWNASLASYLAGFSSSFPTSLAGKYLMAMPGLADPTNGPAGDSIFSLTISNSGVVSLTADMADSTSATQVSQLSLNGYCPVYLPLYDNGTNGSLFGWLYFTGALSNSVSTNSVLTWFNDAGATLLYPLGFTNQALPLAALYNSAQSPLLSFSTGSVVLKGTDLTTPITNGVTISGTTITANPTTNSLTLSITQSTGEITGYFIDPTGTSNAIYSVIIQDTTNVVQGYYLGTNSGSFILKR